MGSRKEDAMNTTKPSLDDLPLVERLRIISLPEATRLSGLSEDGIRRHHSDKIIKLSPRRVGMRVGDALMLKSDDVA
jgi:hypothetical protein